MELRQLKYFITVAQTLSFSEAARKLFITQGTLSQQIQQLEYEMGAPLFHRTSRKVALTGAGEELFPLALKTVDDSERCLSRMRDLKEEVTGTITIGVIHPFIEVLTRTIKSFTAKYPKVVIKVHNRPASELQEMFMKRQLDFALAFRSANHYDNAATEVVFHSKLCAMMRRDHPLADRKSLTIDDLRHQGIILPGGTMQARKTFERFNGMNTDDLDVRLELNNPEMILDLVQSTNLIAVMASIEARGRSRIHTVPLAGMGRDVPGCIFTMEDTPLSRPTKLFLEMFRDEVAIADAGENWFAE